jgi:hypothetical protein
MSLLIIGVICWLASVVVVLGVLRAAGLADSRAVRRAAQFGLAPAMRVAVDATATAASACARPRVAKRSWAAAVVTLLALGMSVRQLGGFEAVVIVAIVVGVGACLLRLAVVMRRRGGVLERQAGQLAMQRHTILSLALQLLAQHDPRAAAARCRCRARLTGVRP